MTSQSHSQPIGQISGLDGLRAIACLMVFGVHFNQFARLSGSLGPFDVARFLYNGHVGVSLFFSLSGFLLSLPYWSALESRDSYPATGSYFLRRAARILPAYYVCLAVLILKNQYWQEANWQRGMLMHALLLQNYLDDVIFSINAPFWSLAVEAQFYVLLPVLFLLIRKLRPRTAVLSVLAVSVGAYCVHATLASLASHAQARLVTSAEGTRPVITYSLLAYVPHFLLGVASGWVFMARSGGQRTSRMRSEALVLIAGLLVIFILSTRLDDVLQIPYGRFNLPFGPVLLCAIIVLAPATSLARAFLDSAPLRGLGAISFGMYIYHLPIQRLTVRYMGYVSLSAQTNWLLFGSGSLVLTVMIAATSYWLVEKPLLTVVKRSGPQKTDLGTRA